MIDSYKMGKIVIDGRTYRSDVLVFPDRVDASWWRLKSHELAVADLADVLAESPEVLVVGSGRYGRLIVLPEAEQALASQGIRLVVAKTGAACDMFNELASAGKHVAAALHLTC